MDILMLLFCLWFVPDWTSNTEGLPPADAGQMHACDGTDGMPPPPPHP